MFDVVLFEEACVSFFAACAGSKESGGVFVCFLNTTVFVEAWLC